MKEIDCVVAAAVLFSISGCYSYSAVGLDRARVGERVRARVTAEQAQHLGSVLGREDRLVDGELLEIGDSDVTVAVPSTIAAEGLGVTRAYQRIAIPRSALLELELRRLDRVRTGLAVGAGTAVAASLAIGAFSIVHAQDSPGRGGSDKMRIPVVFVRLGRVSVP
jgi:hypothetical protein